MTPYLEVRYQRLLKAPLVLRGELTYGGPGKLSKSVTRPYRETTAIDGEQVRVTREHETPRRFSLRRAPELAGVLASFGAMLAGDAATLRAYFDVVLDRAGAGWTIALVPKDARTRQRVAAIEIDGRDAAPRCFALREPDGDASYLLIGDASRAPLEAEPARDAVLAACKAP